MANSLQLPTGYHKLLQDLKERIRSAQVPSGDGPTIGLLLCESRSGPVVEYSLQSLVQPIGISTYRVTRELPARRHACTEDFGG